MNETLLPTAAPEAKPAIDPDFRRYAEEMTKPETRLKRSAAPVIERAAKSLLPEVLEWLGDEGDDAEKVEEQLRELLARRGSSPDADGYTLAKELDYQGWSPDARLVEILDDAFGAIREAHKSLVKAWVTAHGLTLALAVGTRVETPHGTGEIVELWSETHEYLVKLDEHDSSNGYRGHILEAEKVRAVAQA